MAFEQLKLENQICFPIYALHRLITQEYTQYLSKFNITYPQYLVLMVLWEKNNLSISQIGKKLLLNSNTLTPLLKRMEVLDLVSRVRSSNDERKVFISLTQKAKDIEDEASAIPYSLLEGIGCDGLDMKDFIDMKENLNLLIKKLENKKTTT